MMMKQKAPANGGTFTGAEGRNFRTNQNNCQQHYSTFFAALAIQKQVRQWQSTGKFI